MPDRSKMPATVGRVLLLFNRREAGRVIPAIVNSVDADGTVGVTPQYPFQYREIAPSETSRLQIYDPGEGAECEHTIYCEWMPFQKGQHAKTEAVENELGKSLNDIESRLTTVEARLASYGIPPLKPATAPQESEQTATGADRSQVQEPNTAEVASSPKSGKK